MDPEKRDVQRGVLDLETVSFENRVGRQAGPSPGPAGQSYPSNLPIAVSTFLCAISWIEEIFFVWLTLHFLKIRESWFLPTLIGTLSLLLNHLFFFVPWRAGTQEGTMVLTFTLLNLQQSTGLSLA